MTNQNAQIGNRGVWRGKERCKEGAERHEGDMEGAERSTEGMQRGMGGIKGVPRGIEEETRGCRVGCRWGTKRCGGGALGCKGVMGA